MNREKRVANTLLLIYGCVSLAFLLMPLSGIVRSVKACAAYLINPFPFHGDHAVERFSSMPASIVGLIAADVENRDLRRELDRLPVLQSEMEGLRRENERLRGELGMKPAQGRTLRWAKVIERDPQNWYRYLTVNAGKDDGLEINAPVMGLLKGRLGAVGRVTDVGISVSKVLLLSDETSALASYIPAKQWEGLAEGQGGPRLKLNYLPPDAQFVIGDSVYTSPTSATFPPDVLIGHITRVFKQDPFLAFQAVEVSPAVPPSGLKEVLIFVPQKTIEVPKS